MNASVTKLLNQLRSAPWFSNCGKSLAGDFVRVTSLDEARRLYSGQKGLRWENFKLAIMNRQGDLIWEVTTGSHEEIQKAGRATDTAIEQFVVESRDHIFSAIKEDPALRRMVRLDLGWIAGEIEDSRVKELDFFSTNLLPVYLAGHMPCGWSGKRIPSDWGGNSLADLPDGKMIVF